MFQIELAFYVPFLHPLLELPSLSEKNVPDHVFSYIVLHKSCYFYVL